jgi:hypothetical protein
MRKCGSIWLKVDPAQKYLATLENRDIKTTVYPYKGNAPIQPLNGGNPLKAETYTKPDTDSVESITVKFATDQAILGPSGAVISPATAAAHELAHFCSYH